MTALEQMVQVLSIVVVAVNIFCHPHDIVAQLNQLFVLCRHAVESLFVRRPTDVLHHDVIPVVGVLDMLLE